MPENITIVGAGIGGLTAVLALLQRGVDVTVCEQAAVLREVGAGVQLSPNGCRVLASLGLLDELRAARWRRKARRSACGVPARPGRCSISVRGRPPSTAFLT